MSDSNNSGENGPGFGDELREFVHLDSLSVNSLLASLYMAVPEDVERVFEEGEEEQKRKQAEAGLTLGNLLQLGGLGESSETEHEMAQATTSNRINDQYRFTVLYEALHERGKIHDLTGTEPDKGPLNPSDLVKIEGTCNTDPLYRVFGTASLLEEDKAGDELGFQEDREQLDREREELYNGVVGLKLQPKNETGPFGMVVREDELWIDSRREFLGPQEYTVLARVEGRIPSKSKWDLVDSLRILSEILPSKKLNEEREKLLDGLFEEDYTDQEAVDQMVSEVMLEFMMEGEVNFHNIEQEEQRVRQMAEEHVEEQDEELELDPTEFMDRDDFTVDEGYIVDPIAIYW